MTNRFSDHAGRDQQKGKWMSINTETVPTALGKLRKGLIAEGFDEQEAYQIILDLIRRGDSPNALFE